MATIANKIKVKDANGLHDITQMFYKGSVGLKTIASVWEVKNQNLVLIWPKEFDAEVVPQLTYSGNLEQIPASGATIGIRWYLTLYYPNTNPRAAVAGYPVEVTPSSNNWLMDYNSANNDYTVYSPNNKYQIVVPNRERNGLPATIETNDSRVPFSSGPWSFSVSSSFSGSVYQPYGGDYSYLLNDYHVCTQLVNNYQYDNSIVYTNLDLDCYNNSSWTSTNSSNNPASYENNTKIYTVISSVKGTRYKFDSGSTCTKNEWESDSTHYTWSSPETWISFDRDRNIVLSENTSENPRSGTVTAKIYGTRTNPYQTSYTIYQAGKPAATNP